MIIITSDEDIIRKFSLNKTKNTHIIHLDDDEQEISTEIDDHQIINMALLAESVCILFSINRMKIVRILHCRIPIMIQFINEHLIHLIRIQLKHQRNR
jgi:hypothetical protein